MIKDLQSMKLYHVVKRDVLTPNPAYNTFITAQDIETSRIIIQRYNVPLILYDLVMVEELKPTTSNMMGLLYYAYLTRRSEEERYGYSSPRRFESVLSFSKMMESNWINYLHVDMTVINCFGDIVNESRDRENVKKLVKIDLEKRIDSNKKELEKLEELGSNFKNIDLIPIDD